MYIEVESHMCVEIEDLKISNPIGGLCRVGFANPIGVVAGVRRQGLTFIDFSLK
jgi:hypothetical protein